MPRAAPEDLTKQSLTATTGAGLLIGGANGQERTYIVNP
jgi:hypothetical protein